MTVAFNHSAFVALGSNLQDPVRQVNSALLAIEKHPNIQLVKASSLYVTAPVGYDAVQLKSVPNFINAVVEIHTDLTPLNLLHALLAIENAHGRERPFANAPRVLDCDVLLYDDAISQTTELTLPHPRMLERGFVMIPLLEIAPDLRIDGVPIEELIHTELHTEMQQAIKKYEQH